MIVECTTCETRLDDIALTEVGIVECPVCATKYTQVENEVAIVDDHDAEEYLGG